jgi:hypothetical protein
MTPNKNVELEWLKKNIKNIHYMMHPNYPTYSFVKRGKFLGGSLTIMDLVKECITRKI